MLQVYTADRAVIEAGREGTFVDGAEIEACRLALRR